MDELHYFTTVYCSLETETVHKPLLRNSKSVLALLSKCKFPSVQWLFTYVFVQSAIAQAPSVHINHWCEGVQKFHNVSRIQWTSNAYNIGPPNAFG